jgi:hypothetical protein
MDFEMNTIRRTLKTFLVFGIAFIVSGFAQLILDGEFGVFLILCNAYTFGVLLERLLPTNGETQANEVWRMLMKNISTKGDTTRDERARIRPASYLSNPGESKSRPELVSLV